MKAVTSDTEPRETPAWLHLLPWTAFLLIVAAAAFLRVFDIDARPLHSDESVNFLFIEGLFRDGTYPYSHENYHGPLYFYLMGLGIKIFGDGIGGVRAASIFSSLLLLFALLPLRKTTGWPFVLSSALLLSLSPSFVFHSRYAIHETLLLAASLWFASSAFNLWTRFDGSSVVSIGIALGIMISTKETWVITAAAVAFGLLLVGQPFQRLRLVLQRRQSLLLGFLLCLLIVLLNFTNGLQTGNGIRELLLAIPQWVGRGESDVGHFKPWNYYLEKLIWPTEPQLILITLIAPAFLALAFFAPRFLKSTTNTQVRLAFIRFLFGWAAATALVYSAISYKTPWLIINLTLPPILLIGAILGELLQARLTASRVLAAVLLLELSVFSFKRTSELCYANSLGGTDSLLRIEAHTPYGEHNPYSYVHTSPGTLTLVQDLFEYWKSHPDAKVLIGVNGYFPLPYYLRRNAGNLAYLKTTEPKAWKEQYDVIIVDQTVQFPDPEWEKRYYRLSDYAETNTYYKK